MAVILDVSHHQDPNRMDYDQLAKQVDLVIVRTQYGSTVIDRHYKTHHTEFQKRGVPTAAYAWIRGVSVTDMEKEATDFYNRTKAFAPTFWFIDAEEKSMRNMRKGTSAFLRKLRQLGAKKIGIYVGHHVYQTFNLNLAEADAVWIPHYGKNDGTLNSRPAYVCDLHQYTDKGRLKGYNGHLDLNRIASDKTLDYFTADSDKGTYEVVTALPGYVTADQAKKHVKRATTVQKGSYFIFNTSQGMVNVTKTNGVPGSWIDPNDNKGEAALYHVVKKGDTVSGLAIKYGCSQNDIKHWNQLADIHLIHVGQRLRVK